MASIKLVICATPHCNRRVAIVPLDSEDMGLCKACASSPPSMILDDYVEILNNGRAIVHTSQSKHSRDQMFTDTLGDFWPKRGK